LQLFQFDNVSFTLLLKLYLLLKIVELLDPLIVVEISFGLFRLMFLQFIDIFDLFVHFSDVADACFVVGVDFAKLF